MPEGTSYAAVFDKIAEGKYTLWLHGEPRVRDFEIVGAVERFQQRRLARRLVLASDEDEAVGSTLPTTS